MATSVAIFVELEGTMSVAKVSELSCTSDKSFDDAIKQGLARANKSLRNVKGAGSRSNTFAAAKTAKSPSTRSTCW